MESLKNPKLDTEEDDEEALSLIDLPISITKTQPRPEKTKQTADDFNFDFKLFNCSVFKEMCAADDVFFQGRMLPYRHSISSDTGISLHPARFILRSESMDHSSTHGVVSSRSSSMNSQYSSSSGSVTGTLNPKPRTQNYFHSHPSPSPRIQTRARYRNTSNSIRRSNIWDFFRVGLVKTPIIELRAIEKSRNNFGSRSSTSSDSSCQNRASKTADEEIIEKKKKKFLDFGRCKCSINVMNPVICDGREKGMKSRRWTDVSPHTWSSIPSVTTSNKTTSSRHRTFEWIKELSVRGNVT